MSAGDYEIIDKYKVGDQLGITNSQTDDAVENLDKMGLIKKIGASKILLSFEAKKGIKDSHSG
jgi:hypothetical protein